MGEIKRKKNTPKHILWLINKRSYNASKAPGRIRAPSVSRHRARSCKANGLSVAKPNTRKLGSIKNTHNTSKRYDEDHHGQKYPSKLQQQSLEHYKRSRFRKFEKRALKSVKKFHVNNIMKAYIPTIITLLKDNNYNDKMKTGDSPVNMEDVTCAKLRLGQQETDLSLHRYYRYYRLTNRYYMLTNYFFMMADIPKTDKSQFEIDSVQKLDDTHNKMVSQNKKSPELNPRLATEDSIMSELCHNRNFRLRPQTHMVNLLELGREAPPSSVQGMEWASFKDERHRIRSFLNYPTRAAKSALVLAEDGFVYIGTGRNNDDTVTCYFCCVKIRDWHPSDNVSYVHGKRSSNCSMVTHVDCENIPLTSYADFNYIMDLLNPQTDNFECREMGKPSNMDVDTDGASDSGRSRWTQQSADIETDGASETRRPRVSQQSSDIETDSPHDSQRRNFHPAGLSTGHKSMSNERIPNQPSAAYGFSSVPDSPVIIQHPSTPFPGTPASQKSQVPVNTPQPSHTTASSPVSQRPSTASQPSAPTVPSNATRNSTPSVPQTLPASTNSSVASATAVATSTSLNSTAASTVTPPSANQTNSAGGTVTAQSAAGQKDNKSGKGPTYAELGIMTERPKRPEYALKAKRFETYTNWPRHHHLKPEDLSAAGFYFAGYGDCARCFFCGGGLRNWEDEDDVWVEHARWFPKCAYIRQLMGPVFVEKVQELNKTRDQIPYALVIETMGAAGAAFKPDTKENPWIRDPAVKTVLELGFYQEKDVLEIAETLKNGASFLSADVILQRLQDKQRVPTTKTTPSSSVSNNVTTVQDEEAIRQIKERNNQLRQQTVCKICMDKEVAVVFLPCGHLVSCSECGAAMKDCPVCRVNIKGVVRAFMS
ncbi:unnamed protein product [Lymnaea stagnalis]|uniref:RING-type domain-containing protein n=1 Tax=Lymnaea stagnalis TaxID=6523 RepID=A0AAV2IJH7_LYMST